MSERTWGFNSPHPHQPTRAPQNAGPFASYRGVPGVTLCSDGLCLRTDQEWRVSVALVTGSGGLIGSEAVRHFAGLGLDVVGIDNDMRPEFFGAEASTAWNVRRLTDELGTAYTHHDVDIRDRDAPGEGLQAVRPGHRRGDPHRRAAVARLGRAGPVHRLRRQRRRHPQRAAERPASTASTRRSSTARPTRSTATGRTRLPLVELETRWEIDPGPPVRAGHHARTCRSTPACTRSSAPPRSPPT